MVFQEKPRREQQTGMTLVETLITIAIAVTIMVAVVVAVMYAQRLITNSQARLAAMSLAVERIEFFRSLPYHDVGTVGGPVFGDIPNQSYVERNGISFFEDVRVEFVLDPGDDVAGVDSNGIITDYKKVEVELEWFAHGATSSVVYTSNIVPVTVETAEGYGAVKVEVIDDATGLPLSGAEVWISNDTLTPPVDFTRTTGPNGAVLVAVPMGSGYHASTTKPGYSYHRTYRVTGSNPNPDPDDFLVLEALIADRPFRIGELSDITVRAYEDLSEGVVIESFVDLSGVASSSDVELGGGGDTLELLGAPGSYAGSGVAELTQVVPAELERWELAVVIADVPANTESVVRFYTGSSTTLALIDELDLPGNTVGFSDRFIDLSGLDVAAYPDITPVVTLTTTDNTLTPSVDDVALYYRASSTERAGASFPLRGEKIIGSSPDVLKTETAIVTDGAGEGTITDIEFDDYTLDLGSLTATRLCTNVVVDELVPQVYFAHEAGVDSTLELVLANTPSDTFRAIVTTDTGELLPGAEVLLERASGFSETVTSDTCGQAFIANTDGNESDYEVTVSRAGYATETQTSVTIAGDTRLPVTLNAL